MTILIKMTKIIPKEAPEMVALEVLAQVVQEGPALAIAMPVTILKNLETVGLALSLLVMIQDMIIYWSYDQIKQNILIMNII